MWLIDIFIVLDLSIYLLPEIDWVAEIYATQSKTVESYTKNFGYGLCTLLYMQMLKLNLNPNINLLKFEVKHPICDWEFKGGSCSQGFMNFEKQILWFLIYFLYLAKKE